MADHIKSGGLHFVFSLGWILVACGNDRGEYSYQTLADADKAGEITRGWIPHDLIPNSSRAIHLVEELSPSKEWCAFEFPLADAEILRKNLKRIDTLPPSVRRVQTPGVSWWPEVMKEKLNVEKIRKAGFEPYVVERPANSVTVGIYLFTLDWSKGRGFFYWTYRENTANGEDSVTVASVVLEAISAPSPRPRYPVGRQAKLLSRFRKLIPLKFFDKTLRKQFGLGTA